MVGRTGLWKRTRRVITMNNACGIRCIIKHGYVRGMYSIVNARKNVRVDDLK